MIEQEQSPRDAQTGNGFEAGVTDNQELSSSAVKSVLSKAGFQMFNLSSVYYLEYVITTGWTQATTNQILE